MRGNLDCTFLFQDDIFREHAIDGAAERRHGGLLRVHLAARPALKKAPGYFVADLDAGDAGADFDYLAGAVGKWNEIILHRHAVSTARDAKVAEIERTGGDFDQSLPVLRFRHRLINHGQRVDPGAALGQLIGTHLTLPELRWIQPA